MQIGIVGFGYIGSVIGAVLSSKGYRVVAIDSNVSAINDLQQGKCFVPEPALKEMIKRSVDAGLLLGSTSYEPLSLCDPFSPTLM